MSIHQSQEQFSVSSSPRVRGCRFCGGSITEYMGLEVDAGCKIVRWPVCGRISLSPAQSTILAALMRAAGRPVSTNDLIDLLYNERADGGPDWASNVVKTQVHYVRHKLLEARAPLRIRVDWGRGYEVYRPISRLAETIEKGK